MAKNNPDNNATSLEPDLREERELLSWEAPERVFKVKTKDFWITSIAILVLVSIILIFIKEYIAIFAAIAIMFYYYVISTVPPEKITNRLTNRGVYFGTAFYPWTNLSRFWLKKQSDYFSIHFETNLRFPPEVFLLFQGDDNYEKLKKIALRYLPLVESSPRFIDKASAWLAKKLPLEDKPKK